jgi:undecaprenyl-diphosphatase
MPRGEIEIIKGIQHLFDGPAGQAFSLFCARWLVFFFAPLAAFTGWNKKSRSLRHAAYEAAWAGLLALTIAMVLGALIQRTRPFLAAPEIECLIPPPANTYSFPSGHASVAFAIAAALVYGNPSLGFAAFFIASLVAFGRVAAGVHYPSDVLGGLIVGFVSFAMVRALHAAIRKRDLWHRRLP